MNIHLPIKAEQVKASGLLNRLQSLKQIRSTKGDLVLTGWFNKTVKVTFKNERLFLSGSLPKFHTGQNIHSLTRQGYKEAVFHLQDELHLSLWQASISRLDFGSCFNMVNRPSAYLNSLDYLSRAKRSTVSDKDLETVDFINNIKTVTAYNKAQEMGLKGNLLRYEVRLSQKPARQLKTPQLQVGTILQPIMFERIATYWEEQFLKIKIVERPSLNFAEITDWKSIQLEIMIQGFIAYGGVNQLVKAVDATYNKGKGSISRRQRDGIKSHILKITNNPPEPLYLKEELQEKIHRTRVELLESSSSIFLAL